MAASDDTLGLSAQQAGLARCEFCGTLHRLPGAAACRKCGAVVVARKPFSLQRTWAFWLLGLVAYIPANILPIMITSTLGERSEDTIVSGVLALVESGSWFVATIIFVASVCIPVTKFVVIAGLALSLHFQWNMSEHTRHLLHKITELIGRWSMIDVFVVAILAALIQLGAILSVEPGLGINAFALSVVFTMLSATAIDARLFWDVEAHGS